MMEKILVIGAAGQLGQCLALVAKHRGMHNIVFPEEKLANILDADSLNRLFSDERPTHIINCAAYTAVDKAEDDVELARAVNEVGALNLANACKAIDAVLIHISTDFVFAGNEIKLLTETDFADPINVYGKTKLAGEIAIANVLDRHFTVRTSWLYSAFGNNFVKTMLKLGVEKGELNVIADQVGTPTHAMDLAVAIYDMINFNSKAYGLYHYSNEGVTSWYDFATAIFEIANLKMKVNPIPGSAYPTKARRPAFSVMDKSKIKSTFNLEIPYWRNSLVECMEMIAQ